MSCVKGRGKLSPNRKTLFLSEIPTLPSMYWSIDTKTICFALDKHGDLVVPSESTAADFPILFPLAGALNYDAYIYCRVDTVAN